MIFNLDSITGLHVFSSSIEEDREQQNKWIKVLQTCQPLHSIQCVIRTVVDPDGSCTIDVDLEMEYAPPVYSWIHFIYNIYSIY